MTVRAGFLGCGRVASHYANLLTAAPISALAIVAAADIDPDKAAAMAGRLGARPMTSLDALLDEHLDLVFVLTPSGDHYASAKRVVESGRHVLVEKPVVMRVEDGLDLAVASERAEVLCGVMFQNRYNPAVRALRNAIDEQRFGAMITWSVRVRWCRYQDYYDDGWHGTWSDDGGVINQQAIHHVDALRWLAGPVDSVCATSARRLNDLEAEDTLVASLQFTDGSLGTIEATTAARPRDFEASLSVVGERGMAQIGGIALNELQTWEFDEPRSGDDEMPQRASEAVPNGYGLSHHPMIADAVDRLERGETTAPVPVRDGLDAVELVHAIYTSIEKGGWARLADHPRSTLLGRPRRAHA